MKVYIEDISEDYGGDGLTVYSLVKGMNAYIGEVRASGIDIMDKNWRDLDEFDPELSNELEQTLNDYLIKELEDGKATK